MSQGIINKLPGVDFYYYYYYYRSYIAHNTFGKVSMHFRGKIKTENLNN